MTKAWSWLHSDVIRHVATRVPEGRGRARGCREVSLESAGRACQRIALDVRSLVAKLVHGGRGGY